jgi:ribosomal-protein-alanine N-acetyltransferase
VVPEARRQGLGRALLRQFIDDARALNAEQLFLEVRVGNVGAIALYEREAFICVARRVAYYPADRRTGVREDALVMRRELHALPRIVGR